MKVIRSRSNRIHSLFIGTLASILCYSTVPAASFTAEIQADWEAQYRELTGRIETIHTVTAKKTVTDPGKILDAQALVVAADRDPCDVALRRTRALLGDLAGKVPAGKMRAFKNRFEAIEKTTGASVPVKRAATDEAARLALYKEVSALRREVALANPEVDFDTLLFVGVVKPGGDYHMCDQFLGWNARNGGGLYLLTGIRSGKPVAKNLLENVKVEQGALKGKSLSGGAFLSPELSFDAKTVLFAWTDQQDKCYHLFRVNIDGSNLVQLTEGKAPDNGLTDENHNDFDPCFLPGGRIAFISERRGGYGRCHPRHVPTYTLYSMKDDGSDIICLSYHETNEWHPSVDNLGKIVYTRWDYLDRDDCIAHHLWTCDPDGCNPRASHGNYPLPQTTMTGSSWSDGRANRPNGEWNIRAIPGSSKYIATASGHHSHAYGHLVMIDTDIKDDNKMAQLTGITTSQTRWPDTDGPYATAWPLSEDYYLCNYNSQIVLLDKFGNREVLYTSSGSVRPVDPIPVRPRPVPPELSVKTWQGERSGKDDHVRATLGIMNVYNSDLPLGTTSGIKAMRIIQVFPQFTPLINATRIGYASESLARMVLGTVPVEEDGSVYCEAPVGKEIYFQLLDEKGRAVQSMRAGAYVHPGEQLTCLGCHEDKWSAPPASAMPQAFLRPPSKLEPDAGGVEPVNFYRLAQPVLRERCTPCHTQKGKGPSMSYASLEKYAFWWPGPGNPYVNGDIVTAKHGGSRTIPGKFGAIASPLLSRLNSSHNNVSLNDEEVRRITLWLDCNSNELGAYARVTDQKAGKLVWPRLDCDPENPTGIESDRPVPGTSLIRERLRAYLIAPEVKAFVRYNRVNRELTVLGDCRDLRRFEVFDLSGRMLHSSPVPQKGSDDGPVGISGVPLSADGMLVVRLIGKAGTVSSHRIVSVR